ncbi:hypothetical protein Dimus_023613 [Dionaea muscipula]
MGENSKAPLSTPSVLTGTATEGTSGQPIGHVDVGISESAYLFRAALPGVRKDHCGLSCVIEHDGTVCIQGVVHGSELAKTTPKVTYQLNVTQLTPPGPFSILFKLPGPVDPRLFAPTFRSDGILEGVVMKSRAQGVPADKSVPTAPLS